MPETTATLPTEAKREVPDFLRKPMSALQIRVDALEVEARRSVGELLQKSGAGLHEVDLFLERMAREDWTVGGMRRRVDSLRDRAENVRATAMRRFDELPGAAVTALAAASRARVQDLSRGLSAMAKRLEVPLPTATTPPRQTNGA